AIRVPRDILPIPKPLAAERCSPDGTPRRAFPTGFQAAPSRERPATRSRPALRPFPHKLLLPLALACTLLNAVKPLTIDDTAYHDYAAQVAHRPLDPYGFAMFWWYQPEPANEVLAPPLFFYWSSLALRLL